MAQLALRTIPFLVAVALFATGTQAQTLVGLHIDGPDQAFEAGVTNYRAIAEFDDGSEFDVTLFAFLSMDPGLHAAIDGFGNLDAFEVDSDQFETINALFFFDTVLVEADKPVTIKNVPAAGLALDLDGQNDLVLVPDSPAFKPINELTIEIWIRPDTVGKPFTRIVRHATTVGYILTWNQQSDHRAQLRLQGTTQGTIVVKDNVSTETYLGEWHHLAGVYSVGGDFARIYVDGILKGEVPAGGQLQYENTPLAIGNDPIGTEEFDGLIDEVRIWSIARSTSEIRSTMYRPLTGSEPGLVGYWRFDEQSGQTVLDSSPFSNDGLLGNDGNTNGDPADPLRLLSDAPIFSGAVTNVTVSGPDEVAEDFRAAYTATLTFEDGAADGTALADWSIDPPEAGTFDDLGNLTTGDIDPCADLPATVTADYVDSIGSAAGQQAISMFGTGAAGFALDWDGQDDLVLVPASPAFEPLNELTIEIWIRPDSVGKPNARIVRHHANKIGYLLAWQQQTDRRVQLRLGGTTQGAVAVKDNVSNETYLGEWHHLAGVYSFGGNFARIFVDGELKGEVPAGGQLLYQNTPLAFGNSAIGTEEFDGLIDEIRIWNIARTQADIQSTLFSRLGGDEPGLVGYWRFDEGAGQVVADMTANGNNGTLGVAGGADSADPLWVLSDAPIGPPPPIRGDASLDGLTNAEDISWFVGLVIAGPLGDPDRIEQADFDCNGVVDLDDLGPFVDALLTSTDVAPTFDCNGNGIEDACDIDCQSLGGACDVPGCGLRADCNGNGVPDDCELVGADCNGNGVPDECELVGNDCNVNGVPDDCDQGLPPDQACCLSFGCIAISEDICELNGGVFFCLDCALVSCP